MKTLTKILLIHWYGYTEEIIDLGRINFLTGKTAAGKSTIIDALQLVMLGDTSGTFFNKAANEKSVRTLRGYLYGEIGDDGESGFSFMREGPFTSYVVLEFFDDKTQRRFSAGIAFDCHSDQSFDRQWFVLYRSGIPENHFIDSKTRTPYDLRALRTYLNREHGKKQYEFCDSNRRFQEVMLGRMGQLKRKYLTLLKKAVPFTPITDIEKFITDSICDVKNEIRVDQMQSDIRVYRNLEADAGRIQKRIGSLAEIRQASDRYEAAKDRLRQQQYIVIRAEKEELLGEEAGTKERIAAAGEVILRLEAELNALEKEEERLRTRTEALEKQYYSSDIKLQRDRLEKEITELKLKAERLNSGLNAAVEAVRSYGENWRRQIRLLEEAGAGAGTVGSDDGRGVETADADEVKALLDKMSAINVETVLAFDFEEASAVLTALSENLKDRRGELRRRIDQIQDGVRDLELKEKNLKNGIKPFPHNVTGLKRLLEKTLFEKKGRTVEVRILADLLEVRDQSWRDAIEGYLDRQKFYLLVPEEFYTEAIRVYDQAKREQRLFDTGLVDVGRLRKEFKGGHRPGSLAEEIETDDPDARLYADYILGRVMKSERVEDLNRHRTAITRNVTLYKNYVTRRIPPGRYETPFIGQSSMKLQLERVRSDLKEQREDLAAVKKHFQVVSKAAGTEVLGLFESAERTQAVRDAAELPGIAEQIAARKEEYDAIDFTWLSRLETEIAEKRHKLRQLEDNRLAKHREIAIQTTNQGHLENETLPQVQEKIREIEQRIAEYFDAEWVREVGELRYEREKKSDTRTSMTFRDSFQRAANLTQNELERIRKERRGLREKYNLDWKMPYDTDSEDNREYDQQLEDLEQIELPKYVDNIIEARVQAYEQFRDDFIAKMKSNIETVRQQIDELNDSLRKSVFGTDRYHFTIRPRAEYQRFYDMILDPLLMDTGGWNAASHSFNEKYQQEIDELFKLLILNDDDVSAERRAEYEKNVRRFTDYRTYLIFDLIVTNEQGEKQRLSRTLLKKSGGETQIPFYIAMLASFSQVCRIRSRSRNDTVRLIILDEAFSKMDGERIQECIHLLRRFGLQAIFSAPTDKIPDIAPIVDRNIAVYKDGHLSFTRYFDPQEIEEVMEEV